MLQSELDAESSPVINSTSTTKAAQIDQSSYGILANLAGNEYSVAQDLSYLAVEGMHTNTQITLNYIFHTPLPYFTAAISLCTNKQTNNIQTSHRMTTKINLNEFAF